MPRCRGLKPEFFSSASVSALPPLVRLFYQALWCWADDWGRGEARPKELAAFAYPWDEAIGAPEARGWLDLLADTGHLDLYEADGRHWYAVRAWGRHQAFHRGRRPSACPAPEDGVQFRHINAGDASKCDTLQRTRSALEAPTETETETTDRDTPPPGMTTSSPDSPPLGERPFLVLVPDDGREPEPPSLSAQVGMVEAAWQASIAAWRVEHGKRAGPVPRFDSRRRRAVERRLIGPDSVALADVIDAHRGWRWDAHCSGQNDRQTVYNDPETICRRLSTLERCRDAERAHRAQPVAEAPAGWEVEERGVFATGAQIAEQASRLARGDPEPADPVGRLAWRHAASRARMAVAEGGA